MKLKELFISTVGITFRLRDQNTFLVWSYLPSHVSPANGGEQEH